MTATPTPLRELPAKLREEAAGKTDTAYEEGRVAEKLRCARLIDAALSARCGPHGTGEYCEECEPAALSARDEAGAVGSAYDGLCPCCGEIECEEPATPPASGEAGADDVITPEMHARRLEYLAGIGGIHLLPQGCSDLAALIRRLAAVAPAGMDEKPRAYMRRWAFDGIDVMAIPKVERPKGWHLKEVTALRLLDDDVPLFAPTPPAAGQE